MVKSKWVCKNEDGCDKAFNNGGKVFDDLTGHEIDSQLPPYKCDECGKELVEIFKVKKRSNGSKTIILAAIVVVLAIVGAGSYFLFCDSVETVTVSIIPETTTILVGETAIFTAKTEPEDVASDAKWTWTSSNESVATVSSDGVVTGKVEGSATITATNKKKEGSSALVSVIAQPSLIPVESVKLNSSTLSLNLNINKSSTLVVTVQPDNAANKNVEWLSDNPSVATVSSSGLVTAVAEGTANITVSAVGGKNAICIVTVNSGGNPTPCGTYTGESRNGKPHGMGTFTYKTRTLIDDHKMVYAEKGDYITGTFREGKIVSVHLYDSGGNLKQTVIPQQPASICR